MKKIIYIFMSVLLLLSYALPLQAQQAFYIYRNDGVINTFITTEIDSMTYSRLDIDSVAHADYVMHEVYTEDSIYRIPLEAIDSVGFVTPKTVYHAGVKVLEGEMRNYIISRDGLSLMFQNATPKNLLPSIGDKLVTTEVDDVITNAFVGLVSEVNSMSDGIEVICLPVDLTEVFECYYGIIRNVDEPESECTRSITDGFYSTNGTRTFNPGKLSLDLINSHNVSLTYKKDDELSYSLDNARATLSQTPVIDYNAYLIVNRSYGVNVSVTAIGNYTVEELFSLSGNVDLSFDFPFFKRTIPIPEALIDIEFEVGFFGEGQGIFSIDQIWTQNYKHVFHWEWSSKGHKSLQKVHKFINTSNTHTGKVALNGSMAVGAYGKVGVAFIATSSLDIAEVELKYKGGVSFEGTYVPYKRDEEYAKENTDLYNQIKDREIAVYGFRGLSFGADLFKWSVSKEIPNFLNIPFNNRESWGAIRSVPNFSETKLVKDENGVYYASTNISGNVQKTDVGFALINNNDGEDATFTYCVYDYNGPNAEAYASFFDRPASNEYTLYPLVKYMGMELLAEPSAVISSPIRIKELKQDYTTYADGNVTVSMKAVIEVNPEYNNGDMSTYQRYGVYVKNNITGRGDYYSVQENGGMEFYITLDIPREEFETDYNSFTATCDKYIISTYTIDNDDIRKQYGEQVPLIVYEEKPSLIFTNVQVGTPTSTPRYNEKGEYEYTNYYADILIDYKVEGAFWMDYVQSYVYGGDWNDGEGPVEIVNDGDYSNYTGMSYSEKVDMDFVYGYNIYLNNGTSIKSNNTIVFGGSHTQPTARVGGNPSNSRGTRLAKKRKANNMKKQIFEPILGPR